MPRPGCQACRGTGWTRAGRCWICNPRPTREQLAVERRLTAVNARFPRGDAVRRAIAEHERRRP